MEFPIVGVWQGYPAATTGFANRLAGKHPRPWGTHPAGLNLPKKI